jgi:hypothetical protein
VTGCDVFVENHAIQIPLVRWLNDRTLYPHDPYIEALSHYPTPLWSVVALLARLFPLGALLAVLLLLERVFVILAAGRLARAFAPGHDLASAGAMALFAFAITPILGNGTIVASFFEQTGLSIGFFLMAAAAFHERRFTAWAVWLAAGFTLTSLYGVYAVSYFAAAALADPEYRRAWRRLLGPIALFLILISYTIALAVTSLRGGPIDEKLWLAASHMRGWQHLYMRAWKTSEFLDFGSVTLFLLITIALGRRRLGRLFVHFRAWSIVILGWLVLGYVAAYIVPDRPLLMLQPARASDLWLCFAGIASVASIATLVEEEQRSESIALFVACFLIWKPPGAIVAGIVLLALFLIPETWRFALDRGPRKVLPLALAGWVAAAGLTSLAERMGEEGGLSKALVVRPEPALREVAAWARTHTPKDAVFLVNVGFDPGFDEFGALRRSIFTSWDEGTAMFWQPRWVSEWSVRLQMLGFDVTHPTMTYMSKLDALYAGLGDIDVGVLKGRVPLHYWIVTTDHHSRFPVVFENSEYRILDVQG